MSLLVGSQRSNFVLSSTLSVGHRSISPQLGYHILILHLFSPSNPRSISERNLLGQVSLLAVCRGFSEEQPKLLIVTVLISIHGTRKVSTMAPHFSTLRPSPLASPLRQTANTDRSSARGFQRFSARIPKEQRRSQLDNRKTTTDPTDPGFD